MFDYKKKLQKLRNENRKGFAISKLRALLWMAKNFGKNLKQTISLYYCTIYFILLSKANVEQMTKAALPLGLGKLIFVTTIFRIGTRLDGQANHEI